MSEITKTALNKTKTIITAAIVTLASIAWDDVIQTIITILYPYEKDNLQAKIIYAIIITILVISYLTYTKYSQKTENDIN